MGGYTSKEETEDTSDWDRFLTESQAGRQRAYQNDEPLQSLDRNNHNIDMKEKEAFKLSVKQYIGEQVAIRPDESTANAFFVTMTLKSKDPQATYGVSVYEFAKVEIEAEKGNYIGVLSEDGKQPQKFTIHEETHKLEFRLAVGSHNIKTTKQSGVFPIVIEIHHPEGFISVYKYMLDVKKELEPHLIERAVVMDQKYTTLSNVYGLKNSSLVGNDSNEKCLICMTDSIDTIITPCSHMCLCYECAKQLKESTNACPMCREPISSFVKMVLKNDTAKNS